MLEAPSVYKRYPTRWALGLASLGLVLLLFLFSANPRQAERDTVSVHSRSAQRYVGFSVFGPDWPMERGFASDAERLAYMEEQGYRVAQHTSHLYGNLIRVPVSVWGVLGQDLVLDPELATKPVYQLDDAVISNALDRIQASLDANLAAMEKGQNAAGKPLRWDLWDAFFSGIQKYNFEVGTSPANQYHPVFVDLFLNALPPALIIEAPTERTLRHFGCHTSGERLWDAYRQLHLKFIRKLIQRYGRGYAHLDIRAHIPIAVAIEMFNEPDYNWLPDEAKIERALNPDAYPCDKYITQLHLAQIPENDLPGKGCVRREVSYREQDLRLPSVQTSLRDFRWGGKFDKYVSSFADLHEHVSFAARDEIHRGNAEMVVVSSAVTHVNTDWFVRMFRANRNAFRYVDKIAIHPYHWPQHDIHDLRFVGQLPEGDWMAVNPREFASHYFKRFDFIRKLAELVAQPDLERSYGLSGKSIWITEFGIPTKKLGKANSSLPRNWRIFIYDRASPIPEGMPALVWEDKWEAFLAQVPVDFLQQNQVETFLIYTLRESAENETNDDNHSNFALYGADWSCRLAPDVLKRLAGFFLSLREMDEPGNELGECGRPPRPGVFSLWKGR